MVEVPLKESMSTVFRQHPALEKSRNILSVSSDWTQYTNGNLALEVRQKPIF